jgi:probable addiction module antidote protein
MKSIITTFDVADYLASEEEMLEYLNTILAENDPQLLAAALGDIARTKGMTAVSKDTGLGRESLYKALSENGNPSFSTVLKVLASLGIRLQANSTNREKSTLLRQDGRG